MHSSQIIENVAHDLIEGGTYNALTIRQAIESLNRALVALHNEEMIELINIEIMKDQLTKGSI
jgi:hypothetical protein